MRAASKPDLFELLYLYLVGPVLYNQFLQSKGPFLLSVLSFLSDKWSVGSHIWQGDHLKCHGWSQGDHILCHGWSGGTIFSATDGPGGPLLGVTTFCVTGLLLTSTIDLYTSCLDILASPVQFQMENGEVGLLGIRPVQVATLTASVWRRTRGGTLFTGGDTIH